MSERRPRLFLGLVEIGDYYRQLQAGLEELGYDAVFANLWYHPFYGAAWHGHSPAVVRMAVHAAERLGRSSARPLPVRAWWRCVTLSLRLPLFIWAAATRDVFVYGFGSTFFGYRELPVLKWLGKRIVYVFHGSDSRPTYLDGAEAKLDEPGAESVIAATARKKHRLRKIDRWADVVIDNPLEGHLHERSFVSFTAIGVPRHRLPAQPRPSRRQVRVLHSPSNPEAKGTPLIRAAVERLRRRGVELELVELTGAPHAEVLRMLEEVDFVVDQLYADVALAGFAAEAAAAGRAVIVCGYGRDEIEMGLCGRPFPPVFFCHPDEFEQALERLATDETLRLEIGRALQAFVKTDLSPKDVARRFIDAVMGRRPEWIVDPDATSYVHGSGLSEGQVRLLIRRVIEGGGVAALCVRDKPVLEARLIEFADGPTPTTRLTA